jgi:hypothetical protein
MKRAWLYNVGTSIKEWGERHRFPCCIRLGIRIRWAANG